MTIILSAIWSTSCAPYKNSNMSKTTILHKSFLHKITKRKELTTNVATIKPITKEEKAKDIPLITKPTLHVKNTTQKNRDWQWPVKLQNIKMSPQKNGLDIFGLADSGIYASRHGEVVYSGNALRGYGNLIIIKHDNNYLSAYGHNDKILVKEGEKIQIGQKIATMGNSGTDQVKLHFEIRHNGKPIDPSTVLAPD